MGSVSAESIKVPLVYPTEGELITTTGQLIFDFEFTGGEARSNALVDWLSERAERFSEAEASLSFFVEDIGDGENAENLKLASDLTWIKKKVHCGNILGAKLVGIGKMSDCRFGVVSISCEKDDYTWNELIPVKESENGFTYSARHVSSPWAHLLATHLPLNTEATQTTQDTFQSALNVDKHGIIKIQFGLSRKSDLDDRLSNIVSTYEAYWKRILTTDTTSSPDKFEELLNRFSPRSRTDVLKYVDENGTVGWLKLTKDRGNVAGVIDLGNIVILLNDAYCGERPGTRMWTFSELLIQEDDWMIVNFYMLSYINMLLDDDFIRAQICTECSNNEPSSW